MKLSSKERNYLRKLAHDIEPVVRIGKQGLNETVLDSINKAITKQELIKIKILSNSDEIITRDLQKEIEEYAKCVAVYDIGHTMIFFKENKKGKITSDFLEFRQRNRNG